ncbi:MAG TPA: sugar ABC transporter permease [Streptosporangiaceae bacterium]|nr:sugar ABC transporter permease [Streptosporangiaceae bacterium]
MVRSLDQAGAGQTGPPSTQQAGPSGGIWSTTRLKAGTFVRRHKLAPYLLLLPALAGVGAFILWPTIQVAVFSFQNVQEPQVAGLAPTQWVGFANFTRILTDPEFYTALRNSVFFAVIVVPLTLVVGTGVALLLNRLGRKMATFVSMVTMVAWATPTIAATVIFYWIFSPDGGLVDWTLQRTPHWLGGSQSFWNGFNWTTSSALAVYTVLTLLLVWQGFPFIAVSVLAGLKTVPTELYEAARVDGATPWRVFWRVTFPLLKPIFLLMTLLSVIWDFGVFPQAYLLTGSGANIDEWNLGIYAYQQAFTNPANYSLGGAGAFVLTGILLIITVGYLRASVKQGALT